MNATITSLHDLSDFAQRCVSVFKPGDICVLSGGMGVGKTTFVSGFMACLDFYEASSPSFSLVQEYESTPPVYHMDFYRLQSSKEIALLDLDVYLVQQTHIVFIEWASRYNAFDYSHYELQFVMKLDQVRQLVLNDKR